MSRRLGLLLAASRSHLVLNSPSRTFEPNLPFWLFSSNSSAHDVQRKSARGLLLGNCDIFALPQWGQYACVLTQASVQARALCERLVYADWDSSKPSFIMRAFALYITGGNIYLAWGANNELPKFAFGREEWSQNGDRSEMASWVVISPYATSRVYLSPILAEIMHRPMI